jgi:hypothetical protein
MKIPFTLFHRPLFKEHIEKVSSDWIKRHNQKIAEQNLKEAQSVDKQRKQD